MISYYEVLGVAHYATKEEIERAYRWLVQKFHPDRNADFKVEAQSQFVRIQEAFDTLSDPVKRLQYDQELRRAKQADSKATSQPNANESQASNSKRQSLVISPVWLTVIICFAVLGIAAITLKSLSDVTSPQSESRESSPPQSKISDEANKSKDTAPKVPGDAVEFNGHHYKYFDEKSTWYAAKRKCEKMGGHLICVGDAQEDSFAFTLIEKANAESAWIGANNEENQDVWVWVNGEPFSYSGWAPEQPDNWNGVGETCAAIWGSNTRLHRGWHDMSEGYRQGFICEWDY